MGSGFACIAWAFLCEWGFWPACIYCFPFKKKGDLLSCCEHSSQGLLILAWYFLLSEPRHVDDY